MSQAEKSSDIPIYSLCLPKVIFQRMFAQIISNFLYMQISSFEVFHLVNNILSLVLSYLSSFVFHPSLPCLQILPPHINSLNIFNQAIPLAVCYWHICSIFLSLSVSYWSLDSSPYLPRKVSSTQSVMCPLHSCITVIMFHCFPR